MSGCTEGERDPPVSSRIFVRFDPEAGVLPLPTDLVRDEQSGRLALPTDDPALSEAERDLRAWLNTLSGFPRFSPASARLGRGAAPVEPATVELDSVTPDSVPVLDVSAGPRNAVNLEEVERRLTPEGDGVEVVHASGNWPAGSKILVAIRGGASGVRAEGGKPVGADLVFALLRSREPLDAHPELFATLPREERAEAAREAEATRLRLQPHFEALELRGIAREELAALWAFTVDEDRPVFVYDPVNLRIPLPNDAARGPDGRVLLPTSERDDEATRRVKEGLSGYDGFSLSGAAVLSASAPVEPTTLHAGSLRLYAVRGDELEPVTATLRRAGPGGTLAVEPIHPALPPNGRHPLEPGAKYVLVGTTDVRTATGEPLGSTFFNELVKLRSPVFEDGRSSISLLDDATAFRVESIRAALGKPLDRLEAEGLPRNRMGLAVSFTTMGVLPTLRALDDLPYRESLPVDVRLAHSRPPGPGSGVLLPMPNVASIATVEIATFDRLDPRTRALREDGGGEVRWLEASVCVPKGPAGESLPVVIFGHGFSMAKEAAFGVCDAMAAAGFATVAIDLPYHGKRTACLEDAHCAAGGSCAPTGACVGAGGAPGELRPGSAEQTFWSQGTAQPAATGAAFVDLEDVFATRDHFHQSLVDMAALVRVLRRGNWRAATGGRPVDADRLAYVGTSLGAFVGAALAAAEPRLGRLVLSAGGADFVGILEESPLLRPGFDEALARAGTPRGSPDFPLAEMIVRWALDTVDPINMGPIATGGEPFIDPEDGLPKTSPKKRVLVQMAWNDRVVPSSATRLLARRFGTEPEVYAPVGRPKIGGHVFFVDPAEPEGARARSAAARFLEEGEP